MTVRADPVDAPGADPSGDLKAASAADLPGAALADGPIGVTVAASVVRTVAVDAAVAIDVAADVAAAVGVDVETDVPSRHLSLSPSRAADFKACPLRYRFRVVDRLPEPPSPAAVRGTLVHAVLEALFDLSAADRTVEAATAMLPAAWATLQAAEPELAGLFAAGPNEDASEESGAGRAEAAWLRSAGDLLGHYFTLENPQRLEPLAREEYVEVDLGEGLRLRGVIDRLDANAAGALRVVDYKTGSAPSEAWESKALFQLKFYALVLWKTRGVVPAVLQLLYLSDTQRLTYTPDEAELVAFERQLRALWAAISTALASGDFRARRGPLCAWCDHQVRCPEFGGTPPPYPGLAVVDVAPLP